MCVLAEFRIRTKNKIHGLLMRVQFFTLRPPKSHPLQSAAAFEPLFPTTQPTPHQPIPTMSPNPNTDLVIESEALIPPQISLISLPWTLRARSFPLSTFFSSQDQGVSESKEADLEAQVISRGSLQQSKKDCHPKCTAFRLN